MAPTPAASFNATLIDRGKGTGAKRFMEENPEIGEFIRSLTGWVKVIPGSLTLDHAKPLPGIALRNVSPLGEQPEGLLPSLRREDAEIALMRGPPKYYAAFISAAGRCRRVVLSQQPRPACEHRLEIVADVFLRDALQIETGDRVQVDIYNATDWQELGGRASAADRPGGGI